MPRRPDVPCADCGALMWRGTGSLPPGKARCLVCRRKAKPVAVNRRTCRFCGTTFRPVVGNQVFCNPGCRVRAKDVKVGGTTDRGYGHEHQQLRAWWKPKVNARQVDCARCGLKIVPDPTLFGDGWQLDHDPTDPTRKRYLGPSHTSCNQGGGPPGPSDPEPTTHTEW